MLHPILWGQWAMLYEVFLINKGYSRQQSCSAANHIVLGISDNLGGCQGYMPENTEKEHLRQFASYRS